MGGICGHAHPFPYISCYDKYLLTRLFLMYNLIYIEK